jgi:P22 coat protein - gene protein 5
VRESARILHENLGFIGSVTRGYDNRFAVDGAKIGSTLGLRLPARYTVETGATLSAYNDHVERSTPLSVTSQVKVAVSFTTADLTLSLDMFSDRVLKPAVTQLAAHIENDCLTRAYKMVANYTGTTSTQMTFKQFQQGGQSITENLGPRSERTALLNPISVVEFNDAVKGLYQSSSAIDKQYREGMLGRTGGFDVMESTFMPTHTRGTYVSANGLTTGTALGTSATTNTWAATSTVDIDGATSGVTFKAGDVVTFGTVAAGLVDINPETKVSLGRLKKFVVQSDATVVTAGTVTLTVSPALIYGSGNAYQNCSLTNANTDGMTPGIFGVASTAYGQNLQFHKDAFVFATADLVMPEGVWGARTVQDGISMRIVKDYAIASDTQPCRIDVLYGFNQLYPELAVRGFHALA